ncbi:MAG TPA: hypothetical protein PLB00_03105 [Pseudomonadota bacterium]|nr:hypothetical protein [Pseudomonadota bacterium]
MRPNRSGKMARRLSVWLYATTAALWPYVLLAAPQTVITGPAGSGVYGDSVTILPNGNVVVVDPNWNTVGAVYLLRPDGTQISAITGGTPGDGVGSNGIVVLPSGNFLVRSGCWQNAGAFCSGAVTFIDGDTGLNGVVSATNSLVGGSANAGIGGTTVLANGNYLVNSTSATIDGVVNAGAVVWGSGTSGVVGTVSAANSLHGTRTNDRVGFGNGLGVFALANGHYVVLTRDWTDPTTETANVGAITWCNGNTGCTGPVSHANSMTGTQAGDTVGYSLLPLANGNYVVGSPAWANGGVANAGAATWFNGSLPTSGTVGAANSLVGSTEADRVGATLFALANGHYITTTTTWHNGASSDAGAVTWGNGNGGTIGAVSPANSMVGSTVFERVGEIIRILSNGSYLVATRFWDNGAATDAGAVRWGSGNGSGVGPITAANALVGTTSGDLDQMSVIEVGSGNYLVRSSFWDNGVAVDAGAAAWGNGATGSAGPFSAANALVGVRSNDGVGSGALRLANGNYVVLSSGLNTAALSAIGAATWGDGDTGISGIVSAANSLVGTRANDRVGSSGLALANGHYLVASSQWNSATNTAVGAVTWGDGGVGSTGQVTAANSLTGTRNGDTVGSQFMALPNGRALVGSAFWDNGGAQLNAGAFTLIEGNTPISGFAVGPGNSFIGSAAENRVGGTTPAIGSDSRIVARLPQWDNGAAPLDAGAVCLLDGNVPLIGVVNASDCVLGTVASGGSTMRTAYDPVHQYLAVGIPAENRIVIFGNRLLSDGFE